MDRIMKRFDYCVFDLETTGLKPEEGERIIEVGAVRLEGGEITDRFQQLVDPGRPLDDEIVALTGLSSEDLRGQPPCDEVLRQFRDFVGDRYLVAHNANFDMSFLETYAEEPMGREVIDTLRLARTVVNLNDNSLGNLVRVFGVDLLNAHRAAEDAEATAVVFRHLWSRMRFRYHYTRSNLPDEILRHAPAPFWKRMVQRKGGEESLWAALRQWLISPREESQSN